MTSSAPHEPRELRRATRIELLNGHISWLILELAAAYRTGRTAEHIAPLEEALERARAERQRLMDEELGALEDNGTTG